MATRNDMLESKYIQKTDLLQPTRITVAGCSRKDIGQENKPEFRWVVDFQGEWKPLILNRTNTDAFFDTLGENSDEWAGKQIILFNDKSVEYQGKRGGIRVYQQMEVADAQAPQSQFTADNNLAQNPPRTDETGPLPEPPPY
jgi:hypothetical protein